MDATLICSLIIILIGYYIFRRKRRMSVFTRNGINGPPPHLIYGNLNEIRREGLTKCVEKWLNEYGPVFGYFNGGRPSVVVADPELLKQILIKDFRLFHDRNMPKDLSSETTDVLENSLIKRTGKDWKELRTLLRPAFSALKLKGSIPEMSDAIDSMIEKAVVVGKNGETDFDIYSLYQGLTLDVIGRTAFGVRTNVQQNENDPFLKAIREAMKGSMRRLFYTPLLLFPEFAFIFYRIRLAILKIRSFIYGDAFKFVVKMSSHVVNERRKNEDVKRNDLLQSMIDSRINSSLANELDYNSLSISSDYEKKENESHSINDRQLSDTEITSNTILFFEAGYETTSTALAFVTHILVNHQDAQERCRQEVFDLIGKQGTLDYNTVTQLPYMEAVINETLRIYPPLILFVTRIAETDYKYENITIPKGMPVLSPVYHIHHDPKYWEEPEKFDPLRFYGDNKVNTNNLLWQPFGVGPRNCIGMRFAILEMKLALARILMKYRIEPGARTEIGNLSVLFTSILLSPKSVYVRFVPLSSN